MPDYFDTGFCVRTPSWHGKELLIPEEERPTTWTEARPLAGLDWDPEQRPVYEMTGEDEDGNPVYARIENWHRVARSDNGATLALNRDSHALVTNGQIGEIIEAVCGQTSVRYETAGSVEEGRAVWALALLDEPVQIKGDNSLTLPYLAVTSRHDAGSCALRATAVRIVCGNTFRAAEMEGGRTGATYSFNHTKNWQQRVSEARDAVMHARAEFGEFVEMANGLIAVPITDRQREIFVQEFIPAPPEGMASDRVKANVEKSREAFRALFESPTTVEIKGTAYGLVQAAVEYLDYVRTARTWETRLRRTLLTGEPLKARALKLALEVAAS